MKSTPLDTLQTLKCMLGRSIAGDIGLVYHITLCRIESLNNSCLHIHVVSKLLKSVIRCTAIDSIIRLQSPRNTLTITLLYNLDNQLFIKRSNLNKFSVYSHSEATIADHIFEAQFTHIIDRHSLRTTRSNSQKMALFAQFLQRQFSRFRDICITISTRCKGAIYIKKEVFFLHIRTINLRVFAP